MRRPALSALALLLAAGCSNGGNFVVVNVHALPGGATQLIARGALDEQPARMLERFDRPSDGFGSDTSFALKLPVASGRLSVSVEAWIDHCAAASKSGDVPLSAGTLTAELTLDAIDPQDCSGTFVHLPEMVRVPGTRFVMGCDASVDPSCESDEKPLHNVTLSSYFIDRTEVSTAAYHACQAQGLCAPALLDQAASTDAEAFITWDAADNFCHERGKRLPTEAEWELAARGTDGRVYPWGNDAPSCARANFSPGGTACLSGNGGLVVGPIDQFAGVSPYGAVGMAGNVEEWVADWFASAYPATAQIDPSGPTSGVQKVLRGGSWISDGSEVRATRRNANAPDASAPSGLNLTPEENSSTFGIRCARTQ